MGTGDGDTTMMGDFVGLGLGDGDGAADGSVIVGDAVDFVPATDGGFTAGDTFANAMVPSKLSVRNVAVAATRGHCFFSRKESPGYVIGGIVDVAVEDTGERTW